MKSVFISLFFVSSGVFAFPNLVRHGYTSCMTCHYSPSGGGLLNPYGKVIAGELFGAFNRSERTSQGNSEQGAVETTSLPWLVTPDSDKPFDLGLLIRGTQTYFKSDAIKETKFRKMQFDLEGGWIYDKYYALTTLGIRGSAATKDQSETSLFSRRYYAGIKDINYAFRIGKFFPDYGINHPNHNISTRKGLYFNQGREFQTLQGNIYLEKFDVGLAALRGNPDVAEFENYEGYTGTAVAKSEHTKTGFSIFEIKKDGLVDKSSSLFTQIGFGKENGYLLAETAFRTAQSLARENNSELGYLELGYEFYKGFIPYLSYDHNANITTGIFKRTYAAGIQFYPLTHFELIGQLGQVETQTSYGSEKAIFSFLMINSYF